MDAQDFRSLQEAYMEVVENQQQLDEAKVEKNLSPSEKEDVRNVRAFGSTSSKNRATGMRRTFRAAERGVKKEPATGNEKSEISGRFGTGAEVRQKIRALKGRKSGRDFAKKVKQELEAERYIKQQNSDFAAKNAENKISKFRREEVDVYDIILSQLLDEGYTEEESNQIMVLIIENQMNPQEVIGRGIANMFGFDRPNPTQVFGRAFKAAFMNKPKTVQAPKPQNPPKVSPVGKQPSGQKPPTTPPKPNPYRPGATVRATGPNMDKFPELQRFANQGRKIAEPVAKTAAAVSALRNITPTGIAAAVMAPRPTGDATLTGALKRGDYRPKQGPKGSDEGLTRAQSFDKAYKAAKGKTGMGSNFTWRGKSYKVA